MFPTAKSPAGAPTPDRASGYVFTDSSQHITTRAASDSAVLGIDPGLAGAFALFTPATGSLTVVDMPTLVLRRGEGDRLVSDETAAVICVGNLTMGGTGKTPTVIALVTRLAGRGSRCMWAAGGVRSGSRAGCTARPTSATSRCFSPPSPRSGSGATGSPRPAPRWRQGRRRSCSTTGSRTRGWPRMSRSSWSTPPPASATAAWHPPGPCANRWPRGWRGPTWCWRWASRWTARGCCTTGPSSRRGRWWRAAWRRSPRGCPGGGCAPSPSPASAARRSSSPPCAPRGPSWWQHTASPTTCPMQPASCSGWRPKRGRRGPSSSPPKRTRCASPPAFRTRVLTLPVRLEVEDWTPIEAALARTLGAADPGDT